MAIFGSLRFGMFKSLNNIVDILLNNNIKLVDAPKIKISSSHIRELIKSNQKIDDLVPKEVLSFFKSIT